jgi:ketol-acid reductoisomerase
MAKVYYEKDTNIDLVKGKVIAVIGYGNQGRGQSLNLKDNGCEVVVGLYEGSKSRARAEADGVKVASVAEAAKAADIIMLLAPDSLHQEIYNCDIAPGMSKGNMLMVSHGFTVHYGQVIPSADIDVTMVAPKSPGTLLRELYTQGQGVPALLAVHQDASVPTPLAVPAPEFWRQPLPRKPRPISSASRPYSAAALPPCSKPPLRHWWKRATSPSWLTSNVSMSSSSSST